MSRLLERTEIGVADKGGVFLLRFANQNEERYEVRMGNHTVLTTGNKAQAITVANALAGVPEATSEPEAKRGR